MKAIASISNWRSGMLSLAACLVAVSAVFGCAVRHGADSARDAAIADNPLLLIASWCAPGGDTSGLPGGEDFGDSRGVCCGAGHGVDAAAADIDGKLVVYQIATPWVADEQASLNLGAYYRFAGARPPPLG